VRRDLLIAKRSVLSEQCQDRPLHKRQRMFVLLR
jgi:hypothetical protein